MHLTELKHLSTNCAQNEHKDLRPASTDAGRFLDTATFSMIQFLKGGVVLKSYKIQLGVFALVAIIALIAIIFSTPKALSGEEIASYLSEKQEHTFMLQQINPESEQPILELTPVQVEQLLAVIESSSFQNVPESNASTNQISFTGTEYLILVRNQAGNYVFAMQWSEGLTIVVTIEGKIDADLQCISDGWQDALSEICQS